MTDETLPFPDAGGVPPATPTPNAGLLVAAWCDGYRSTHDGDDAHPALLRRAAGQARTLAKDCSTVDHWREAWRACFDAGKDGRYAVADYLGRRAPQQHYRPNADVDYLRSVLNNPPKELP